MGRTSRTSSLSSGREKRLFVTGPKIMTTKSTILSVPGCGKKTAAAIWRKLPYSCMASVHSHQEKSLHLHQLFVTVLAVAEKAGSASHEHYYFHYKKLQEHLVMVNEILESNELISGAQRAKFVRIRANVLKQLARDESKM